MTGKRDRSTRSCIPVDLARRAAFLLCRLSPPKPKKTASPPIIKRKVFFVPAARGRANNEVGHQPHRPPCLPSILRSWRQRTAAQNNRTCAAAGTKKTCCTRSRTRQPHQVNPRCVSSLFCWRVGGA